MVMTSVLAPSVSLPRSTNSLLNHLYDRTMNVNATSIMPVTKSASGVSRWAFGSGDQFTATFRSISATLKYNLT